MRNKVLLEYEKICSLFFKGVKMLVKIVVVYLICWFLYVIEVLLIMFDLIIVVFREVYYMFVFFCYMSVVINFFLYVGFCKDFCEVF